MLYIKFSLRFFICKLWVWYFLPYVVIVYTCHGSVAQWPHTAVNKVIYYTTTSILRSFSIALICDIDSPLVRSIIVNIIQDSSSLTITTNSHQTYTQYYKHPYSNVLLPMLCKTSITRSDCTLKVFFITSLQTAFPVSNSLLQRNYLFSTIFNHNWKIMTLQTKNSIFPKLLLKKP